MKKVYCFLMVCLYVLGCIGGIGYTVYDKAYPIAAGIAVAGWMAWPKIKELFNIVKE